MFMSVYVHAYCVRVSLCCVWCDQGEVSDRWIDSCPPCETRCGDNWSLVGHHRPCISDLEIRNPECLTLKLFEH